MRVDRPIHRILFDSFFESFEFFGGRCCLSLYHQGTIRRKVGRGVATQTEKRFPPLETIFFFPQKMLKILRRTPLRHFSTSTRRLAEVEVFVNGQSVMIEQGSAVIQAAEKLGVTIPR